MDTRHSAVKYCCKGGAVEPEIEEIEKENGDALQERTPDEGSAQRMFNLGLCFSHGYEVEKDEKRAVNLLQQAAREGHAGAMFNLGVHFENGIGVTKDESVAVELYKQAVSKGSTNAMCNLGLCYESGRGINKDEKLAISWYRQAADRGHATGMFNLAVHLENGWGVQKDEKKAIELYQRAASKGSTDAMCNLALCFAHGRSVVKDENRAVELYMRAAENGHARAMYNLAAHFEDGIEVQQDENRAVELLKQAASKGNADAMCNLGLRFEHGYGVKRDEKSAVDLYRKAANNGHDGAMFNLAVCFENGIGVENDEKCAVALYAEAASMENSGAKFRLAVHLENGRGVEKDEIRAIELYRQAAHEYAGASYNLHLCVGRVRGMESYERHIVELTKQEADKKRAVAMYNMGLCFEQGYQLKKDTRRAFEMYKQAADEGYADAINKLGVCYHNGWEVETDEKLAIQLYQQAADKGNPSSICNLGLCFEHGYGVEKDEGRAVELCKRAAYKGDPFAMWYVKFLSTQEALLERVEGKELPLRARANMDDRRHRNAMEKSQSPTRMYKVNTGKFESIRGDCVNQTVLRLVVRNILSALVASIPQRTPENIRDNGFKIACGSNIVEVEATPELWTLNAKDVVDETYHESVSVTVEGVTANVDAFLERCTHSMMRTETEKELLTERSLSFIFEAILGVPISSEDSLDVPLAAGLSGCALAHIEISRILGNMLNDINEETGFVNTVLNLLLSAAQESTIISRRVLRPVCRRMLVLAMIYFRTNLSGELLNALRKCAESVSQDIVEISKVLHADSVSVRSRYLGIDPMPHEGVLRIMHIPQVCLFGIMEATNGVLSERERYKSDDKIVYTDILDGALLSKVLDSTSRNGITPSELLRDLLPYIDRTGRFGCWVSSMCDECIRPMIKADEPMILTLPHGEFKMLSEQSSCSTDGEVVIYHLKGKVEGLEFWNPKHVSADQVVVMLGGRNNILSSLRAKAQRASSYSVPRRTPLWNEWFDGLELRIMEKGLFFLDLKEKDSVTSRNLKEAGGSFGLSAFGIRAKGGGNVALSEKPIPDDYFAPLNLPESIKWISCEQLNDLYERHKMWYPQKWEGKDPKHLRNARIWQFLQLAALKYRVKYNGEACDALYSNPNPRYDISSCVSYDMRGLGHLYTRRCKWSLSERVLKLEGYLELDTRYDMYFKVHYPNEGILLPPSSSRAGKLSGNLYKQHIRRKLIDTPAHNIYLRPADSSPTLLEYEKVVICGIWGALIRSQGPCLRLVEDKQEVAVHRTQCTVVPQEQPRDMHHN